MDKVNAIEIEALGQYDAKLVLKYLALVSEKRDLERLIETVGEDLKEIMMTYAIPSISVPRGDTVSLCTRETYEYPVSITVLEEKLKAEKKIAIINGTAKQIGETQYLRVK